MEYSQEEAEYRSLEGTLMYLGNYILLQVAMMASKMKQRVSNLKISHVLKSNKCVEEVLRIRPYIRYVRSTGVCNMALISLS